MLLILALVLGIYATRLTTLTIRGEESRWARVACEILDTGDWLVPRQQGTVFADRPPLASWAIAATMLVTGQCDAFSVRFPSLLATLLTCWLIYGYSRTFLSSTASLSAAAAYATMGQVLERARLAETEPIFTLFAAAALMLWHWGYTQGWRPSTVWMVGYVCAALATLSKGAQGPVYFIGPVWAFLLLRRDWRYLLSPSHAVSLLTSIALVAAWQVPYALSVDADSISRTWTGQIKDRLVFGDIPLMAKHMASYPWEVLGCLLPWSVLLAAFVSRRFRQELGERRNVVLFMLTCIAVTFPTVWIVPAARGRYYMPLYPCFAVLVGVVIEQLLQANPAALAHRQWRWFVTGLSVAMIVGGAAVLGATVFGVAPKSPLVQPLGFALVYAAAALGVTALAWQTREIVTPRSVQLAVLAIAAFLGLTYTGVVTNSLVRKSEDVPAYIAELKRKLPADAELTSLNVVHHLFRYHYGKPVEHLKWPKQASDVPADLEYFCYDAHEQRKKVIPFAWEQIAVIPCDRMRSDKPNDRVVVGRRIKGQAAVATRQ